jgi:tetratricopeptide (TPR) repeat protein
LQADLLLEKRRMPEAIVALEGAARHTTSDELRAEIELRTGVAHYHVGDFLLAGKFFDLAGERSPKLRETALFNGALSSLQQKNLDRFLEQYRELANQFPDSELRPELILEQGLLQARIGDTRAIETLELFLHNFSKHPRRAEARLALAELAFANQDVAGATRYLKVADQLPQSSSTADHAAYLAVFLADADSPRDEQRVIDLAKQFIREHAQSPLLPEVRMKLGQIYFRNNDFPNAETQLVSLARESPQSAHAETALFLAGQAAMKTTAVQRALDLFDEVVKRDGPLKLRAREQQALIESGLGKAREAIALYDIILTTQPAPEPELRHAALCGKADNYLALGTKDPPQIDIAIALYSELATSDAPPMWRNQALYKKGKALEQQSRTEDALSTYYDVLNQSGSGGREYFWFYKAGFDAARIFEAQEQWKSAIGIYEKMARMDGPRAPEARELVRRLRLERFIIWE